MANERLQSLIAEALRLPAESIVDSLDMQESGAWDSLTHMQLIAAIEDEFHIELTADEIVAMTSIAQIKSTLRKKAVEIE